MRLFEGNEPMPPGCFPATKWSCRNRGLPLSESMASPPETPIESGEFVFDDDGMGKIVNVVTLKPSRKAKEALRASRRRTDAAAFREHVKTLGLQPTLHDGALEDIDLEKLVKQMERAETIRENRAAASRANARRNHRAW